MSDGRLEQGTLVWGRTSYKQDARTRPWIIMSTDNHPHAGAEYLALPLTTAESENRIRITDDDLVEGKIKKPSNVTPWSYGRLHPEDLEETMGVVKDEIIEQLRDEYLRITE